MLAYERIAVCWHLIHVRSPRKLIKLIELIKLVELIEELKLIKLIELIEVDVEMNRLEGGLAACVYRQRMQLLCWHPPGLCAPVILF